MAYKPPTHILEVLQKIEYEDALPAGNLCTNVAGKSRDSRPLQMQFGAKFGVLHFFDQRQRLCKYDLRAAGIVQLRHGARLVAQQTDAYQQRRSVPK